VEEVNYSDRLFIVDTGWGDRWQIYHRLTELKIPCKCSTGKPLEVTVDTPTAAVQVWSVARQQLVGRSQLVNWLDRCFDLHSARNRSELLYD
jgi:hypothetical protein